MSEFANLYMDIKANINIAKYISFRIYRNGNRILEYGFSIAHIYIYNKD